MHFWLSFYVDEKVLLDRMNLVFEVVMADSMERGEPRSEGKSGHLVCRPTETDAHAAPVVGILLFTIEGDRQQARGASLRNSHIFPAASGDRGPPAQCPPYTCLCPPARPDSLIAREGDRRAAAVQP